MTPDTRLVTAGREPERFLGAVNPPVFRTSTVLSATLAEWDAKAAAFAAGERGLFYGRHGTPTTDALLDAVTAIEGGYASFAYPSGLAACITAILAFAGAGDHILVPDSVYGPVRKAAGGLLRRAGIETSFYDPLVGAEIAALLRPNTRLVYVESPGSHTFEVQDVPAIADVAHRHGAVVVMDNTWATPLYFKSFDKGVDVSIHAATKYIVGHSDSMFGLAITNAAAHDRLRAATKDLGQMVSPDDAYVGQRGLRTLHVRLARHWQTGLRLAEWLKGRPEVVDVIHPALEGSAGHALWKRDFTGASGLFGIILRPCDRKVLAAFVDGLELFGIGASWGGFESLVLPVTPHRDVRPPRHEGELVRFHAGLEDPDDLIEDLKAGFARMARVV